MKNQYFGDVNDYYKYGLLRALGRRHRGRVHVCWMLTPDDSRTDGSKVTYLSPSNEVRYRSFDPELYDKLRGFWAGGRPREVASAQVLELIPGAHYFEPITPDPRENRERWMRDLSAQLQEGELVFFDPDNGMEVKSKAYGTKDSCKYLYWRELVATWERGHGMLVYQHYPRVQRAVFRRRIADEIFRRIDATRVIAFSTSHVVFFLIPTAADIDAMDDAANEIETTKRDFIGVERLAPP